MASLRHQKLPPLNRHESIRIAELLASEPALVRWFALIEQDVEEEAWDAQKVIIGTPADEVKTALAVTVGKRSVVATLTEATLAANKQTT